jgi:hypothetical protein
MISSCLIEQGKCFIDLGRLDKATDVYKIAMSHFKQRNNEKGIALTLGSVDIT